MMGNLVFQTEAAELAAGQIHLHVITKPSLRADRITVPDHQHPDHQFETHRRVTQVVIMALHLVAQPTQVENGINPPQQMIGRQYIFQIEFLEKAVLPHYWFTRHRRNTLI